MAFRLIGAGAESISTHKAQKWCEPHSKTAASDNNEAHDNREANHSPTPLKYVNNPQDIPENPPDPGDGDGDRDLPDDPDDNEPEDEQPGEEDRFLQVISDLATGI
jgi:hypothetical protein